MATYLVQGATTLYRMTHGGVATALTLPTGFSLLGTTQPCRAAMLNNALVVVNGATHDFWVDHLNVCRPLRLTPPANPPALAAGSLSGGITNLDGIVKAVVTFQVYDADGQLLQESAASTPGVSISFSAVSTGLEATRVAVSGQSSVNARGVYVTDEGGSIYYPWMLINDNTRTSVEEILTAEDVADTLAPFVEQSSTPPDFKIIVNWRDRLWAVPRVDIDYLRWSEERQPFNWPAENEIVVPQKDVDTYGNVLLIPRRDALGIVKHDCFHMMTGHSQGTFQRQNIADIGAVSSSTVVVRDVGYFLGFHAGRYVIAEWSDNGVIPVSEAAVDNWLNSSTYFNETYFPNCEVGYNPETDAVEFSFAAAGSSSLDRWISYHLRTRTWYGPHKTAAFTPSARATAPAREGTLTDSTGGQLSVFGSSDGYLYKRDSSTKNDHTSAVDFDVDFPFFSADEPDYEKVWLQPSIHSRIQAAGTLTITPKIGALDASTSTAISHTLTLGREKLRRLGRGRYAQLNLRHNTVDEGCGVFGIELPYIYWSRR